MKPTSARVHDLVAKTARVTIKDTFRVLMAARVVAEHLDCSLEELTKLPCDLNRATPEQADACSEEFKLMCKQLNENGRGGEIRRSRQID